MSLNWNIVLAVGCGGALGSILRLIAVEYMCKIQTTTFPFGILFVNIIGSFLIGILYAYFSTYETSPLLKIFLITGFLGGLTTFSTFALDSYLLLNSSFSFAILNIISNLFGSIFAVFLGFKIFLLVLK